MTINQAITLTKNLLKNHSELKNWTVTTNRRKRAFGCCDYTDKQIELSQYLVPLMTDWAIKDTILHEIAHALTPIHNHDKVWKAKCIELGGDGKRCHGAEKYKDGEEGRAKSLKKIVKYTLTCPVCGATYHKCRKPLHPSSCSNHGSRVYNVAYKLVLTQNY